MDRRSFLKIGALAASSGVVGACGQVSQKVIPYVIPPEDGQNPVAGNHYATTCRECEAGCGVVVRTVNGRAKKIEGNAAHPISHGRACVRGQAAVQRIYHPERLSTPMVKKGGKFEEISWDEAIAMLSEKIKGADGSVFFLNNGSNDALAGVADAVFGKQGGFLMASNHDFGRESLIVGGSSLYDFPKIQLSDMSEADFTIILGSDMSESGVSPVYQGYTFGESRRGRPSKRGRFVFCGSRLSPTAASADKWLPVVPGQLGMLALSIAHVVVETVIVRELAPSVSREILGQWKEALKKFTPEKAYKMTEVKADYIRRMAAPFVDEAPAVMVAGEEMAGYTNGVSGVEAVEFVNMLSFEVGREKVKLSQAKAPKADPALKAGFLADFGLAPEKQSFKRLKGLTEVMAAGQYKVGIIAHTNPVFDTPKSLQFKEALAKTPFKAAFTCFMDETAAECDLILPDNHWLESWSAQTPNFRPGVPVLNLVQPVVTPFLKTKQAGDVLLQAAASAGLSTPAKNLEGFISSVIAKNRASLKGVPASLDDRAAWNHMLQDGGWWTESVSGAPMDTPSSDKLSAVASNLKIEEPAFDGGDNYPFHLHPYHTAHMGRGVGTNQAWMQEAPDPMTTLMWQFWIELNPATAAKVGVIEGDLITVKSPHGSITGPAFPFPGIRPDVVAVPVGYGHTKYGKLADGVGANAMDLLGTTTDEASGALAFRSQKVSITKAGGSVVMMRNANPRGEYKGEIFQL